MSSIEKTVLIEHVVHPSAELGELLRTPRSGLQAIYDAQVLNEERTIEIVSAYCHDVHMHQTFISPDFVARHANAILILGRICGIYKPVSVQSAWIFHRTHPLWTSVLDQLNERPEMIADSFEYKQRGWPSKLDQMIQRHCPAVIRGLNCWSVMTEAKDHHMTAHEGVIINQSYISYCFQSRALIPQTDRLLTCARKIKDQHYRAHATALIISRVSQEYKYRAMTSTDMQELMQMRNQIVEWILYFVTETPVHTLTYMVVLMLAQACDPLGKSSLVVNLSLRLPLTLTARQISRLKLIDDMFPHLPLVTGFWGGFEAFVLRLKHRSFGTGKFFYEGKKPVPLEGFVSQLGKTFSWMGHAEFTKPVVIRTRIKHTFNHMHNLLRAIPDLLQNEYDLFVYRPCRSSRGGWNRCIYQFNFHTEFKPSFWRGLAMLIYLSIMYNQYYPHYLICLDFWQELCTIRNYQRHRGVDLSVMPINIVANRLQGLQICRSIPMILLSDPIETRRL